MFLKAIRDGTWVQRVQGRPRPHVLGERCRQGPLTSLLLYRASSEMKRMWSSRIWTICSQMLYCGLLLEDVHVHLGVKGKHALPEGCLAEDTLHSRPTCCPGEPACSKEVGATPTEHRILCKGWERDLASSPRIRAVCSIFSCLHSGKATGTSP